MKSGSTIGTPAAAGALIRRQRIDQGLTQQALADAAGVSRKFLIDLESGHERAELGKTLAVFAALGLSLVTTTPIPVGSDQDPARRDYAATFTELLARKDFEFAIKMLADYASASLKAGRPLLQRSPQLKDAQWLRPWRESPTTRLTASTNLPRPGQDASNPSTKHGCRPSHTGASANP